MVVAALKLQPHHGRTAAPAEIGRKRKELRAAAGDKKERKKKQIEREKVGRMKPSAFVYSRKLSVCVWGAGKLFGYVVV